MRDNDIVPLTKKNVEEIIHAIGSYTQPELDMLYRIQIMLTLIFIVLAIIAVRG